MESQLQLFHRVASFSNTKVQSEYSTNLTVAVPEIWDILEMGKKSALTILKF